MSKLALVTGASAGIGYHLAEGLVDRGYEVIAVGASDRIAGVPERLGRGIVHPVQTDLSTREGVDETWKAVAQFDRPLEVAVLNAGVSLGGAFAETDIEEELRLLSLNVTSQVLLAKNVVRHMVTRERGRILFTSSLSALTPTPYGSIYGPTRSFVYSFAQGLREELREHGITVTALLPGATATGFHDRAGMQNTAFGDNSVKNDPQLVSRRGLEALFADRDQVVGGNARTRRSAFLDRFRSQPSKARRFAQKSHPRDV